MSNYNSTFVAVRTKFIRNGIISFEWLVMAVENAIGLNRPIRCARCEGEVRIHRQLSPDGPVAHVEHIHKEDSERCPNGFHYLGKP